MSIDRTSPAPESHNSAPSTPNWDRDLFRPSTSSSLTTSDSTSTSGGGKLSANDGGGKLTGNDGGGKLNPLSGMSSEAIAAALASLNPDQPNDGTNTNGGGGGGKLRPNDNGVTSDTTSGGGGSKLKPLAEGGGKLKPIGASFVSLENYNPEPTASGTVDSPAGGGKLSGNDGGGKLASFSIDTSLISGGGKLAGNDGGGKLAGNDGGGKLVAGFDINGMRPGESFLGKLNDGGGKLNDGGGKLNPGGSFFLPHEALAHSMNGATDAAHSGDFEGLKTALENAFEGVGVDHQQFKAFGEQLAQRLNGNGFTVNAGDGVIAMHRDGAEDAVEFKMDAHLDFATGRVKAEATAQAYNWDTKQNVDRSPEDALRAPDSTDRRVADSRPTDSRPAEDESARGTNNLANLDSHRVNSRLQRLARQAPSRRHNVV